MRIIFGLLLVFGILSAKSELISPIPPAYEIWIDLDIAPCDEACLSELIKKREFASFMAKYSPQNQTNKELLRSYNAIKWGLDPAQKSTIALLLPKSLKSYAKAIKTTIQAYVLSHDAALSAHFIHCQSESDILSALKKARERGANVFIAPVKELGLEILGSALENGEIAYIPTLNRTLAQTNANIIFGGIDYAQQVAMLARLAQSKSAIFTDSSELAQRLDGLINEAGVRVVSRVKINNDESSIKALQDKANALNEVNIFLNLPLIKMAFAINYLPKFEIKPKMLLSTQVGFNPQIFSLISPLARGEMIVASAINGVSEPLNAASEMLGFGGWHNWVSYSSVLGFERLSERYVDAVERADFKEQITAKKVQYDTKLYRLEAASFVPLDE